MRRRTRPGLNLRLIALYALIFACFFTTIVSADHVLRLDSVQRCDSTNDIKLTRFNMTYYKDNETIAIDLAGTSDFALNGTAHFMVLVFGSSIYQQDFPLCGTNLPQVCPISNGPFNVTTWIPAPSSISSALPTFLFNLPDLGIQTKLSVSPLGGSPIYLCIVAGLSNSGTTTTSTFTLSNPYITLVSALFCIVAFLTGFVSLVVAILYGADEGGSIVLTALALASPGLQDLVSYCQHIAYNAQFELAYPDIYRTFASNFAWTLGLINSPFTQQAIHDMRARYGGHPDQDPIYNSGASSLPLGLGANSSAAGLARRAVEAAVANVTPQNTTASGVEAYLYALRVPTADAFMTVLLVFLIILAALTVVMMIGWPLIEVLSRCVPRLRKLASEYGYLYSGYALRLILMAYSSLLTYAFYQFTLSDSWLSLTVAIICIVLLLLIIFAASFQLLRADSTLLSTDIYHLRYGFLYSDYRTGAHRFFLIGVAYTIAKAILIALARPSSWTQVIGNLLVEAIFFLLLLLVRPYSEMRANAMQGGISFVRVVGAVILVLFVGALAVDVEKKTVAGLVLIVLHGLVSVVLYLLILVRLVLGVVELLKGRRGKDHDEEEKRNSVQMSEDNHQTSEETTDEENEGKKEKKSKKDKKNKDRDPNESYLEVD